jgi:hypothetical protein
MGQLNIKDEAVIAEARALAAELGVSVTGAVGAAVRALRLARAREREAEVAAKVEDVMAIAARVSARTPAHLRTSDHADLYGEDGLPK